MVLSVVMPVYNEEAVIERVIREHLDLLSSLQDTIDRWEILCLDDGSVDRTPEILEAMARHEPRIRVVRHPRNMGISVSLKDLYTLAVGTYVYVTGSDGQWPASNLTVLLKEQRESGADFVIGVRSNRREVYSFKRQLVSNLFNLLPRMLFGVKTGDAGSNKLGRSEIFRAPIVSQSPFAEAERILRASLEGYRVSFAAIEFLPRTSGRTTGASWKHLLASLRDVLRCLRTYGFYPAKKSERPR
jgi:glycosyltransferase involved in cell wall biosynthesis